MSRSRNEDGKEAAKEVDGLEQCIHSLQLGINQRSDSVKMNRFGTLLAKVWCSACNVPQSNRIGSRWFKLVPG